MRSERQRWPQRWATFLPHCEFKRSVKSVADSLRQPQYYVVQFPEALKSKESITLQISYHVLGALRPLPASIKQEDKQYLTYSFSAYVPSAYTTLKQKTKLKFPSSDVPEYTTTEGISSSKSDPERQGSSYTYGTYDTSKVPAGTKYPISVRYEFTKPLLAASLLERDVEVSHWGGNIAFEERYWLRNDGATLADHFSRVSWATQSHYAQAGMLTTSALRELKVPLKAGSLEPYFVDDIGNISTSRYRPSKVRDASLELKLRYPLFGGWFHNFKIGWSNNLSPFLRRLKTPSDTYVLNVPLLEGPKMSEGIQYEHLTFRIILPEGSSNVNWEVSGGSNVPWFNVHQSLHKTFMDTLGRTELKLEATNVVDELRDASVVVTYNYTTMSALRKPMSIIVGAIGLFAVLAAVRSIDTSIGKKGIRT